MEAFRREVQGPDHPHSAAGRGAVARHRVRSQGFHRVDRHHMRHYSGDLRRVLVRVGRHAAFPPAESGQRRYSGQGDARRLDPRDSPPRRGRGRRGLYRKRRNRARGRRAGRSRVAAHQRIDPHGRTGGGQNRRRGAFRFRSDLSFERRTARYDRGGRLRRSGCYGRGRCDRSGPRHRAGDRPERRADAAQPPADTPLETHRPGRHCACGRYFLRHARQGGLRRWAVRARLARNIAAGAAHFHGLGGHHRDGRSRRTSDEHYTVAGDVHAAHAQDQQPRAAHARLRNDGRRDGHLHRQDRHADPEPDARAGTGALRCASGA